MTEAIKKKAKRPVNTGQKQVGRAKTQFKKGQSGNPNGRPLGSKNFTTDFNEAIKEIADLNKISISDARKVLFRKAYAEAKDGSFPFYKDIMDRYYGKPMESLDLTSGDNPIPILGNVSKNNRNKEDIGTAEKDQGDSGRGVGEQEFCHRF